MSCSCTTYLPLPGPPGPPGPGGERVVLTGEAAVPLGGHRAVYRRPDGLIDYASATDPGHMAVPIWITTGAAAAGDTVTMVAVGGITEGSWSWAPGPIFLGAGGALVQALPPGALFLAVIAAASTATTVWVDRQPSIDLI
ncbi:hypothetical protein ACPESR_25255 [Nocardia testacea]|uniref:hypothetical protein n=1 Tax=Nocardia testacea TaxID=248551 RepID=UPI003C2D1930